MKTKILSALFAIVLLVSCKDDDDKQKNFPEENPLAAYIQSSGFSQKTTNFINSSDYEFGYKFKPKVKGKINALTFKIPDNASNVRVTIWNAATQEVLRTITIPSVTANSEVRQNIDPMSIDPAQEYLITYNGNDWYERKKNDGTNTTYPIDAGNISITGYRWHGTTSQSYPVNASSHYYAGDLSIVFQQTE